MKTFFRVIPKENNTIAARKLNIPLIPSENLLL